MVGSVYKIIAKFLSLRLHEVMDEVTSNSQGAFVKGRQIMNDILIVNECVDGMKKLKELGLVC